MLAESGSPKAMDALIDSPAKAAAARTGSRRSASSSRCGPAIPAVNQMLADMMFSGRNNEQSYAAQLLGRTGTEDARQALLTALTGKDKSLASIAASSLSQMGMTDQVKSALLAWRRTIPASSSR